MTLKIIEGHIMWSLGLINPGIFVLGLFKMKFCEYKKRIINELLFRIMFTLYLFSISCFSKGV